MTYRSKKEKLAELNPDPNQIIWRYLDFPKFLSLLESKEIYFRRLDLFNDSFEGSVSQVDIEAQEKRWGEMSIQSGTPAGLYSRFYRKKPEDPRKYFFLNCWHMGDKENMAMWNLYSHKRKGIVIKSSVEKLSEFMPEEGEIRCVQYLDYKKDKINEFSRIYCKRKAFAHEKEVRAVIKRKFDEYPTGLNINANPEKLIEEIRLSPEMPQWICKLVEKIIDRYGFKISVEKSELNEEPIFDWEIDKDYFTEEE